MNTFEQLDLRKEKVLNLKKSAGIETQKAQVVLALDFSYSMEGLYISGAVQEAVERLLPLGLAFDDNGEVDSYLFHDNVIRIEKNITQSNVRTYVDKYLRVDSNGNRRSMGGTNYAPVISAIMKQYTQGATSLIGRLLGSSTPKKLEYPVYVMFITDGDNSDHAATEALIREASNHGIFFQFVGIGHSSFRFLEKLDDLSGRKIDNANFFKCPDLSRTLDDELYQLMLKEFPSWIPQARQAQLIN